MKTHISPQNDDDDELGGDSTRTKQEYVPKNVVSTSTSPLITTLQQHTVTVVSPFNPNEYKTSEKHTSSRSGSSGCNLIHHQHFPQHQQRVMVSFQGGMRISANMEEHSTRLPNNLIKNCNSSSGNVSGVRNNPSQSSVVSIPPPTPTTIAHHECHPQQTSPFSVDAISQQQSLPMTNVVISQSSSSPSTMSFRLSSSSSSSRKNNREMLKQQEPKLPPSTTPNTSNVHNSNISNDKQPSMVMETNSKNTFLKLDVEEFLHDLTQKADKGDSTLSEPNLLVPIQSNVSMTMSSLSSVANNNINNITMLGKNTLHHQDSLPKQFQVFPTATTLSPSLNNHQQSLINLADRHNLTSDMLSNNNSAIITANPNFITSPNTTMPPPTNPTNDSNSTSSNIDSTTLPLHNVNTQPKTKTFSTPKKKNNCKENIEKPSKKRDLSITMYNAPPSKHKHSKLTTTTTTSASSTSTSGTTSPLPPPVLAPQFSQQPTFITPSSPSMYNTPNNNSVVSFNNSSSSNNATNSSSTSVITFVTNEFTEFKSGQHETQKRQRKERIYKFYNAKFGGNESETIRSSSPSTFSPNSSPNTSI